MKKSKEHTLNIRLVVSDDVIEAEVKGNLGLVALFSLGRSLYKFVGRIQRGRQRDLS